VLGTPRSRPVACEECHQVPDKTLSPGHVDSALPAEVRFSGVASAFDSSPGYVGGSCVDSYCHGADFPGRHESGGTFTAPSWTEVGSGQASCGSCHGLPPPLPHPPVAACADCHRNLLPDHRSFRFPELHVNGIAETVIE
jgi:predicted CxxxxCH...CXXCH cytochrome family protein